MIIVKRRALIALLLLSCIFITACASKNASSLLHAIETDGAPEDITPTASYDCVIVPSAANDVLVARARALTTALTAQTGIAASLFFDNEDLPKQDNMRLILLGNTSHSLSQKHLRDLKYDDYLCRAEENALILGGKSDAATIAAIDRFSKELLPYADPELLINDDQQFLVCAEYPVTSVTLCGFSLNDYRIVYPKANEHGEAEIAATVRDTFAKRCGFYLDILPDSLITENVRIIAIGACRNITPTERPTILADGSVIALYGTSEYTLSALAQSFCEYVIPNGATGDIRTTLSAPIPVSCTSSSISALPHIFSQAADRLDIMEITNVSTALRQSGAALAPFSVANRQLFSYLEANLFEYASVSLTLDDEHVLPFFYDPNILLLTEQRAVGSSLVLRFAIRNTDTTITVIHALADNAAAAKQIAEQDISANEPTILFLVTPSSLPLADTSESAFQTPHAYLRFDQQIQTLLSAPTPFSYAAVTLPQEANDMYQFHFTHPFLMQ